MSAAGGEQERLVVVYRVTTRCNLRCGFCAYDRRLPGPRVSSDAPHALALGALLAAHRRRTGQPVLVSFLGGEPLLWPALGEVSRALFALGLELGLTTNGTLLSSPRVRALVGDHYAELTVSVDGLGVVHDRLRGSAGGFAALRRDVGTLAAQKRTSGRGPLLRANTVLMRSTLEHFMPLCRELARWGIEQVTWNPLGGRDRPEFYAREGLLPEQAARFARELPAMQAELARLGLSLRGNAAYAERMRASAERVRLPVHDCAPARRFVFVAEDGRIAPCSFTLGADGYAEPLAAPEPDALAVLATRFAHSARARRNAACDDCHSTQVFGKYASP